MAITRKFERDIDLLLAEEFLVNPDFASWFRSRTRFAAESTAQVVDVDVSKATAEGESDLIVYYQRPDGSRFAIFIEDKIGALLQPSQADRYVARAARMAGSGYIDGADFVLCAPSSYIEVCSPEAIAAFRVRVTYEELATAIESDGTSPRARYRASFLREALAKPKSQWQKQVDEETDAFWMSAYDLASRHYPILEMRKKSFTKGQTWVSFRPHDFPTMPRRVEVAYKGGWGFVDLAFSSTTAHRMHELLSSPLPDDMTLHQTGKSASIRITVPEFVITEGWECCKDAITAGFEAASRLIAYFREHRSSLLEAADAARQVA